MPYYLWDQKIFASSPSASTSDTRKVVINEASPFMDNTTITSKYTVVSFLPVALFGQFRRFANMYFLLIGLLMLFGETTGYFLPAYSYATTLIPLMIVITVSLAQEALTDLARHRADDEVNSRDTEVVAPMAQVIPQYKIRTGMTVLVLNKEQIPADMVLLATSNEANSCYIDTASIDGETSLKIRRAPQLVTPPGWMAEAAPKDEVQLQAKIRGLTSSYLECEHPNERINVFNGTLEMELDDGTMESVPVNKDHVLLRGSSLHSDWALGLVVYTGAETKLALNARTPPQKLAQLDRLCNRIVLVIFGIQILLAVISVFFAMAFEDREFDNLWYTGFWDNKVQGRSYYLKARWTDLQRDRNKLNFGWGFCQFLILYANFIPLSLYVSLEICFITLVKFVDWDVKMYHAETNTPALARSPTVTDLGQVKYIFSDKTGTLTRNEMKLRRAIVRGKVYTVPQTEAEVKEAEEDNNKALDDSGLPSIEELSQAATDGDDYAALFMESLMLCNTIVVEGTLEAGLSYQAESPDEGALVHGGSQGGYVLAARTEHVLCGTTKKGGPRRAWEILATNEFDNDRKRMSIFLREHIGEPVDGARGVEAGTTEGAAAMRGKVILLCKGADNAMLQVAAGGEDDLVALGEKLDAFATQGLRTLVFGMRLFTDEEFESWKTTHYSPALCAMKDRDELLKKAAMEAEKDLIVVGATAIEDKLQVGVPETISVLADAGIKLWVLTGDKRETAVEIGKSCKLLRAGMPMAVLSSAARKEQLQACVAKMCRLAFEAEGTEIPVMIAEKLEEIAETAEAKSEDFGDCVVWDEAAVRATPAAKRALVVDGEAMLSLFGDEKMEAVLFGVLERCDAVIACRVTPKQKAQLVVLVQTNVKPKPVTLAIGDGANDVNMIMSAQVGVGISGHEGRQAVNASDFAIAQFCYLERLLLVHGRWGYRRVAVLVLYSFYKNACLAVILFCFCFASGFSGTSLFSDYFSGLYNFFLFLFIYYVSVLDRDVDDDYVHKNPQLYASGRDNLDLTVPHAMSWIFAACVHGVCIYIIPFFALRWGSGGVEDLGGYVMYGGAVSMALVTTVNMKAAIEASTFTTLFSAASKKAGNLGIFGSHWFAMAFNAAFMVSGLVAVSYIGNDTEFIFQLLPFWAAGTATLAHPTTWALAFFISVTCVAFDLTQRGFIFFFKPDPIQVAIERCNAPKNNLHYLLSTRNKSRAENNAASATNKTVADDSTATVHESLP